jgi:Polycystin cation channel
LNEEALISEKSVLFMFIFQFLSLMQVYMFDSANLLQQNLIIGNVQLRQIRVRNDTCMVHPDFEKRIATCYSVYAPEFESIDSYGSRLMTYVSTPFDEDKYKYKRALTRHLN